MACSGSAAVHTQLHTVRLAEHSCIEPWSVSAKLQRSPCHTGRLAKYTREACSGKVLGSLLH